MSDEHAWPRWLGRDAEAEPVQIVRTIGYRRTASDAMTESPNTIVEKKGSVLTARIRDVRRSCNNGWMSRIETSVAPSMKLLWSHSDRQEATSLDLAKAATVATWAVKTAWVHERSSTQRTTPTSKMRRYLMDHQLPPEFTGVWVARHVGRADFAVYVGQIDVTHQDDQWDAGRSRHVLVACRR